MRAVVFMTALVLSGCASQKFALVPPAGVDLSGHWVLNEAESDDPQRLIQNQNNPQGPNAPGQGAPGGGNGGGGGGRGGGRGRGQGGPGGGFGGPTGGGSPTASPAMIGALGEGLRWPGKELEVKQIAGVVAFTSGGRNRVYTPSDVETKPAPGKHRPRAGERDDDDEALGPLREGNVQTAAPTSGGAGGVAGSAGAGGPAGPGAPGGRGREAQLTACGWDERTLVVQSAGARDDRNGGYEQRFLLSDDSSRLIEIVGRKGYRGEGFTLSRVWDRMAPGATPSVPPTPPAAQSAPPTH